MKYRNLGNTGLLVSELALGTMVFGENSQRSTPPEQVKPIIDQFLDAGGNHIDTANVYAGGRSEELVGSAIQTNRHKIILATKTRFPMGSGPNDSGLSRYHIINSVEASLRRLKTDYIDLLYMHCWDPITPIEESLRTFDNLVNSGKVRYIGVSNFKAWQLMKALCVSDTNRWIRFSAAQYQYSLVERNIENEFSDLFLKEGLGLVPWGPLGGGFLTGKYKQNQKPQSPQEGRIAVTPKNDEEAWENRSRDKNWKIINQLQILSQKYQASVSQIAIAWLKQQPAVASVIVGIRTQEQLMDNLGAADLDLSYEDITLLSEISKPETPYPYGFLNNYGKRG